MEVPPSQATKIYWMTFQRWAPCEASSDDEAANNDQATCDGAAAAPLVLRARRMQSEEDAQHVRMRDALVINFSSATLDGGHKDFWITQNLFPTLRADIENTTRIDRYLKHPERYIKWRCPPSEPASWESRIYKFGSKHGGFYVHVWSYANYQDYRRDIRVQIRAWLESNMHALQTLAKGRGIYIFHGDVGSGAAPPPLLAGPARPNGAVQRLHPYIVKKEVHRIRAKNTHRTHGARQNYTISYTQFDRNTTYTL